MPAPSLTALLDFESQFHFGSQSILSDAGLDAFLPGAADKLPDDCTMVKFRRGGTTGDQTKRPNGLIEFSRYVGVLEVSSRMLKSANVPSSVVGCNLVLDERRGLIRSLFLKSERKFTLGKLPWLAVTEIEPLDPEQGVDDSGQAARDAFTERWRITFEIRPDAWPS